MADYPTQEVNAILTAALRKRTKRHAAEVTSDRLGDAVTRWADQFTAEELDMIGMIRNRLSVIASDEPAADHA